MAETDSNGGQRIKSVERAIEIIEALGDHGESGVSELADQLGIPTSTVHAYLKTLADTGYVIQSEGRYRLSYQFLRQGGLVRSRSKLFHITLPYMKELAEDTSELFTISLGVEENLQRVLVYKIDGEGSPFRSLAVGQFALLHTTALGKVLLAGMSEAEVDEVIDRHGLPGETPQTITSRDELLEELTQIRDRGFSVDKGEAMAEQRGVAVPIHDGNQELVGAIAIGGPEPEFDHESIQTLSSKLKNTATLIEIQYNQ